MNECPKCHAPVVSGADSCAKCGVILAKFSTEKARVYSSQVIVSTAVLHEPFSTVGPVYAVTTNRGGVLDRSAAKLGINVSGIGASDVFSAVLFGDSLANYKALPVAFAVCVEQLKRQAAAMGADAVIGVRMNFDLDRSGIGMQIFDMQLIGTAVKRGGGS